MATLAAARDIPILIRSPAACSERRVNPSWTISQLKARLEPITGIAPALQTLAVRQPHQKEMTAISAADEDRTEIGSWSLLAYAELHVRTLLYPSLRKDIVMHEHQPCCLAEPP